MENSPWLTGDIVMKSEIENAEGVNHEIGHSTALAVAHSRLPSFSKPEKTSRAQTGNFAKTIHSDHSVIRPQALVRERAKALLDVARANHDWQFCENNSRHPAKLTGKCDLGLKHIP